MKPLLIALALVAAACGTGTIDTAPTLDLPPGTSSTTIDQPTESTTAEPFPTTTATAGLRIIVQPDSSGQLPPDVLVGCSTPKFPASALNSMQPIAGSGLDQVEAEMRGFLDTGEGQHWPQDGWLVLHKTEKVVLLVHVQVMDDSGRPLDEPRVAFMTIEQVNGDWRWAGAQSGGPCRLETSLPDDLNRVDWRIDPSADPLTTASTRINVLVTERACASGQVMGDRLLGPEVVMTEAAVLIAFAANPPPGGFQDCPSNPEQPVVVDLPEPLGDRQVFDGLAVAGYLSDYLN